MTYEHLLEELSGSGALDDRLQPAFEGAPRRRFIPPTLWVRRDRRWRRLDRAQHGSRWYPLVDSDQPLVTELDHGNAGGPGCVTAGELAPSTVVLSLKLLGVTSGGRVLEVGTGWSTALLSALAGGANVTSWAHSRDLAAVYRGLLRSQGHPPNVLDPDQGKATAKNALFDYILVNRAVRHSPWEWVERARPGARIVLPLHTGLSQVSLLALTVGPDRASATGTFHAVARGPWELGQEDSPRGDDREEPRLSNASSSAMNMIQDPGARAFVGIQTPGFHLEHIRSAHPFDRQITERLRVHDKVGSRAVIFCRPPYLVYEWGPRSIASNVFCLLEAWKNAGSPSLADLKVSVSSSAVNVLAE
ncbi:protein-L-isoaspartate O-methyltransferase family protein [Streptomyces sp. NPDC054835]|uniref:protein-L-isoaspartate O-methyltransferase family protein n=1 Tax=Streptomyces exfoliatus TaxID=1905 RepID=UPI000996BB98|nr:hypothetical protein [Streptomyces exfoliatus]